MDPCSVITAITAIAATVGAGAGFLTAINLFYRLAPIAVRSEGVWRIDNRNKSHPVVIRKIFNDTSIHLSCFRDDAYITNLLSNQDRLVNWDIGPESSLKAGFFYALRKVKRDGIGGPIDEPIAENICQPVIKRRGFPLLACFTGIEFDLRLKERKGRKPSPK
jgi:hypothetical protein